jgi:hypothetical protein
MIDREALEKAAHALAKHDGMTCDNDWREAPKEYREDWADMANVAITAYLDAMRAKGWKFVPEEPTNV